jgi:glycosyltransferase involved in cell wall biosynthesis
MSRVDVIIPCYNYGRFLGECVESVRAQPVDLRILVIDDASSDDTPEVAARLRHDPRVEYRRHATNRGHIATYNEGLEWASADYTLLLSADDLLAPGALLRASRLLDQHPEVGLAYGRAVKFQSGEPLPAPTHTGGSCGWNIVPGLDWIEQRCRNAGNAACSPEVLVRTSLQHELGGYLPTLPYSGDLEMWLRFAARSDIGILDSVQAYYRLHGRSMTDQSFSGDYARLQQLKAAFDTLLENPSCGLPGRDSLRKLFADALVRDCLGEAYSAFHGGDAESSRRLTQLALETDPSVRSTRFYRRLVLMGLAGPRLWSLFRRLTLRGPVPGLG